MPLAQRGVWVEYGFSEKTALKHAIETFGVPHCEVGRPEDLSRAVGDGDEVEVWPFVGSVGCTRFLLDCHLGRLAKYLRILGFDTRYEQRADDAWLAETSAAEDRALLTMDRGLLMRRVVRGGALVRAVEPQTQLVEVVERFGLEDQLRPLTRCLRCNGALMGVEATEVWERIPPKTRLWCTEYLRCAECRHVYWRGSHWDRMKEWVETALAGRTTDARTQGSATTA